MHVAHCKVGFTHLPGQPLDLIPFVAKNDGLSYCERIVEIAESLEFVVLLFDCNKKLLYAI